MTTFSRGLNRRFALRIYDFVFKSFMVIIVYNLQGDIVYDKINCLSL